MVVIPYNKEREDKIARKKWLKSKAGKKWKKEQKAAKAPAKPSKSVVARRKAFMASEKGQAWLAQKQEEEAQRKLAIEANKHF
ncbi:hypothetical protein [Leclercia adecarboxylata]|uniref:hypothetical protein n=1 Tax=Leclercia adecarboxylata TaxID=83655 RepID=UPI002949711D|nr:hypothetical protein [Leclercia adecarboxylata]MDV5238144.1 hypothetical protein [Leclercia adecarboxylata]MDV5279007.1 hypothetical protein [Leclercia adecarboxylata]MDV5462733.1 hypothetical protein [Leclercia adecarboxylata]MDV5502119.1 hypothetical protein [Leclercia adecarboxylata]MDV5534445.1 hypothetical protein [Leclercia adecarboxylata]